MSKYRYSQRIGRGGMAEVFLGMQEGIGGFEKLVVIKRIFQHYCEDERFLQMFMDEARLAASIRHPNVVEILDIDRDATGFFIVMEYLSGETLGYVIPTLQSEDRLPPPHLVCRIGASIAAGLHQAHTAHDATGAPQPVVHRDVTPSNVIVCYNGVVKLLDFGVAKAIMSGEGETRVRGVKGKLSYLAPEQIANAPVDARTDIFQLGIVIHEMLTGRGLFHASNAHQRVLAVMEREIPRPSLIHPDVPPILDDIVLAALERDPEKRVQSADELRARLEQAILAIGAPASDRDVGAWMRETFSDAYSRRLALERSTASQMRQSRQVAASPPSSWTPGSQTGEGSQPSYPGPATGAGSHPSHPVMLGSSEPSTMTMASKALRPHGSAPHRRRTWLLASLLLLLVAGGTGIALSMVDGADAEVQAASETTQPAPRPDTEAPPVVVAAEREKPPAEEPVAEPVAPAKYTVALDVEPGDAVIELDGAVVGQGSFQQELTADGHNHVLVVSADGYKPRVITFRDQAPERRVELQALAGDGDGERRQSSGSRSSRSSRRSHSAEADDTARPDRTSASEPVPVPEPETRPDTAQKRRTDTKRPTTDNLDPWAD
ncbi:MAG TPA: protein kinase [Haliangium sp.]|nr:protein kinase [Haliangium sp.]